MADISIHSLPAASALSGTEGFMLDQAAASKLGTVNQVRDFVRQTPANGLQYDALEKVLATASDIVDVFIYDTRLDTDGGTWRLRSCFTAWYNEPLNTATRGARKEFPAVVGLVLRNNASALTIYDLTDLDVAGVPRMWKVFNTSGVLGGSAGGFSMIHACQGRIFVPKRSTNGGFLRVLDLVNDVALIHRGTSITFSNSVNGNGSQFSAPGGLGETDILSVAARVLSGAPLDVAGLPIPTVAVGTGTSLAVIHPTGFVSSITTPAAATSVRFLGDGRIAFARTDSANVEVVNVPYAATVALASAAGRVSYGTSSPVVVNNTWAKRVLPIPGGFAVGHISGATPNLPLCLVYEDQASPSSGMVAYVGIDHATGYQVGDIRGAYLCDNATGNLVGANIVNLDGSSVAGFTNNGDGVVSSAGGEIVVTFGTSGQTTRYYFTGLTPGQTYYFQGKHRRGTAVNNSRLRVLDNVTVLVTDDNSTTSYRTLTGQVTPTGTTLTLELQFLGTPASGETIMLDDLRLDVATPDRSYKGKGLIANGTLSRNAVGTGNDVVAFGGFSTSNYLSQPYNSDLDFGTGDFSVTGWFNLVDTSNTRAILQRGPTGGPRFEVLSVAGSGIRFDVSDGTTTVITNTASSAVTAGQWAHFVAAMRGGQMELWINGVRVDAKSRGAVGSLSGAVGLLVGVRDSGGLTQNAGTSSIALLRISATAPTPAQIRKMYQDEVALFDAGAKATLAGNSNSVVSLSVEESTGVLSAATGDGVSRFSGLRRIDYLDTASVPSLTNDSMKAVAAQAGVILLAGGAQAVVKRDQVNGVDAMNRYQYRRPPKFRAEGVTADATPTNLSQRLFVGEREQYTVMVRVVGRQYGAAGTENFRTVLHATVARDAGGNVTLLTTAASQKFAGWNGSAAVEITGESTSTMDAAIVVDTASQTLAVQVTGKAATRIVWAAELISETRISEETQYALAA